MSENKVLAKVNGKEILLSDVYNLMSAMPDRDRFNNEEGVKALADELVNQELILEDAKKREIDKEKQFQDELELVKDNMLKNYAMQKILNQVQISDKELIDYYNENKESLFNSSTYTASHILVDSLDKAKEVLEEINNGLDFGKAAKKYSLDPSKENGGSLGTFPKGVMVKEFQDGLDSIEVGQISKPVKSQFGYHIIKLDGKKEEDNSFEKIKDQVKATYEMKKRQEKYLEVVNQLLKTAEVKKFY